MRDKLTVWVRLCEFYRFTGRDALPDFFLHAKSHICSQNYAKSIAFVEKMGYNIIIKKRREGGFFYNENFSC